MCVDASHDTIRNALTSLPDSSIVNLRGMPSNRAPVETHHPVVRTHPVTGLKALNFTPGAVTDFPELTTIESNKLLELLDYHINTSDEHTVRFKWEPGSVAIWDNRCTAYKSIAGSAGSILQGIETAYVGEKRKLIVFVTVDTEFVDKYVAYFDPRSESRKEREERLVKTEKEEQVRREEIKARYNSTPLRRILQVQATSGQGMVNRISFVSQANDVSNYSEEGQPIAPEVKSRARPGCSESSRREFYVNNPFVQCNQSSTATEALGKYSWF